jgi:hypothetical protein
VYNLGVKEKEIDCLSDCDAWCCTSRTLAFEFSDYEVVFMEQNGADLSFIRGKGYFMNEDCPFLKDNKCVLHKDKRQPRCCVVNKVGGELCLKLRDRVFERRGLVVDKL